MGGFHVGTSTFLVETMERYLRMVGEEYRTDANAQMRLYSLLHARPLVGRDLVAAWQARAAIYPDGLIRAMLAANLPFDGVGYAEEMFAARDDIIKLYDIYVQSSRQILGALLGLNRLYRPNPGFRSMDEVIGEMRIKPPDLAARLRAVFRLPPTEGVAALHTLIADIFALVETHVPGFDTAPYRAKVAQRRSVWDGPPVL